MKLNNIYTIITFAALAVLAGCSTNQSGKSYCVEKGTLSAYVYNPQNNACKADFRYRNLARHVQKPIIDITAYDNNGKIVAQSKIRFPEVRPGASRNLSQVLECGSQKISRIYVNDAVDANRCYGYDCSALCDIKGMTIELTK